MVTKYSKELYEREKGTYIRVLIYKDTHKRMKLNAVKEGKSLIEYIDIISKLNK